MEVMLSRPYGYSTKIKREFEKANPEMRVLSVKRQYKQSFSDFWVYKITVVRIGEKI